MDFLILVDSELSVADIAERMVELLAVQWTYLGWPVDSCIPSSCPEKVNSLPFPPLPEGGMRDGGSLEDGSCSVS